MKKRVVFSWIIFVLAVSFVSGFSYNVSNVSMRKIYAPGEFLSGTFFLNLTNAPTDLIFESDFGEMSMRKFFLENGLGLSCESFNCTSLYKIDSSLGESLSLNVVPSGKVYGFLFTGPNVMVSGLNLTASSSFGEMDSTPLSISIGDYFNWEYSASSTNINSYKDITDGCFNESSVLEENIIRSTNYCEKVNLSKSNSYFLGANISGSGFEEFILTLKRGFADVVSCNFSKDSASYNSASTCSVNSSNFFPAGEYSVCIKSKSDDGKYTIRRENSGTNCGYFSNVNNLTADYSLLVAIPKYASSSGNINLGSDFSTRATSSINQYLQSRYSRNCLSGCVVPIVLNGQNIALSISNISLRYSSSNGESVVKNISNVSKKNQEINFSNFLNIEKFGWVVSSYGNSTFKLLLDNKELLKENISVMEFPIINFISPTSVPAGLDFTFYADVENAGTNSSYQWDFGDNSSVVRTSKPFVIHKYNNYSSYNLNLTFSNKNYSVSKSVVITSISPREYINFSLNLKRSRLGFAKSKLNLLPFFARDHVDDMIGIDYYESELNKIEADESEAYSLDLVLDVALRLSSLIVPWEIILQKKQSGSFIASSSLIKPEYANEFYDSGADSSLYNNAIVGWQIDNINGSITKQEFIFVDENGISKPLITHYVLNLQSNYNGESALFIQEKKNSVFFSSSSVSVNDIGGEAIAIVIPAKESLSVEFYINGSNEVVMFVSPSLSLISLEQKISPCNYNLKCEKSLGENSDNCEMDCKPVTATLIWALIIFIIGIIIYGFLQIWYKKNYEKYLFKDRAELFNMITFIDNAKANQVEEKNIYSILFNKGWDKDQINYAINKANGRRAGYWEILPVEKISAYIEMKKAQKNKTQNVAPPANPQMNRNPQLNRGPFRPSGFQRRQ